MRRVVTGLSAGKSVFVKDEESPHTFAASGFELGVLWATHGAVDLSNLPDDPAAGMLMKTPAPNSSLCQYCVIPPASQDTVTDASQGAAADYHLEDNGFTHTTDTIDCGVILRGEVWLELDDGERRLLRAGDSFVQNGTRHSWHNESDQPALMFVVMIGAQRTALQA